MLRSFASMDVAMDKITDKIKKLLRLSENNPSLEEAAAAFAMAQKLASLNGLNLDSISTDDLDSWEAPKLQNVEERLLFKGVRVPQWRSQLAMHIAKANGCGVYLGYSMGKRIGIKLYGQPRDMDTVEYMFKMACREVDRLAANVVGRGKSYITGFRVGAAVEIGKKIRESARQALQEGPTDTVAEGVALVVRNKLAVYTKEVEDALATYSNSLGLRTRRSNGVNGNGYTAGRAAGATVNVSARRALGA